jgi:hypothetical protein
VLQQLNLRQEINRRTIKYFSYKTQQYTRWKKKRIFEGTRNKGRPRYKWEDVSRSGQNKAWGNVPSRLVTEAARD